MQIPNDTETEHTTAKKNHGTHVRTVKQEQLAARANEEVRLRRLGYSYREIAEKLDVSPSQVHADVQKVLEEIRKDTAEDAEAIRQMELERIDSVLPMVLEQATSGELKAIDAMVKLMDRRSKYLGLDAAQKQETGGIVTVYLRESQEGEL